MTQKQGYLQCRQTWRLFKFPWNSSIYFDDFPMETSRDLRGFSPWFSQAELTPIPPATLEAVPGHC
jgi:hypothetical protein